MKTFVLTTAFLALISLTACNKEVQKMKIVKNCTGVYLQARNGKEYKVCNDHLLDNYAAGKKIKVTFDNLEQCFGLIETPSCGQVHAHEGVIEITSIK